MKNIKYIFRAVPFVVLACVLIIVGFISQFFHHSEGFSIGLIIALVTNMLWALQAKLDLARTERIRDKLIKCNAVIYALAKRLKTLHNDDLITLDEENHTFTVAFEEKEEK